jgi:hypothetical protein
MCRAEEQARIREVLIALGGSPEVLDDKKDQSNEPVTLDSRIAAYTRLQTGARARTRPVPEPDEARDRSVRVRTGAAPAIHLRPIVARAARALAHHLVHAALAPARLLIGATRTLTRLSVHAVRLFVHFVVRAACGVGLVLRRAAAALTHLLRFALPLPARAAAALTHSTVHAVRLLARVVLRAAGGLGRELARVTTTLARSAPNRTPRPVPRKNDRGESRNVAAAVTAWVHPEAQVSGEPATVALADADAHDVESEPGVRSEPDVRTLEAHARRSRPRRTSLARRAALALLAVVVPISAVTLVLQHRYQGGVAQAQQDPATARLKPFPGAEAVPSRASFSDPRASAAAMTRLALASGRTELDGTPACDQTSTWDRWTCRARGKPTLGAYAGHWLTYRCSPTVHPQPGGRPGGVMIDCRPANPPSLAA